MTGRFARVLIAVVMVGTMTGAAITFALGVRFAPRSSCGSLSYGQHCHVHKPGVHSGHAHHHRYHRRHWETLTGFVKPHHARTGYYFQWGACTGFPGNAHKTRTRFTDRATGVSVTLMHLQGGVQYCYRLVAFNKKGRSVGGIRSFKTRRPARGHRHPHKHRHHRHHHRHHHHRHHHRHHHHGH